MKKYSNQKGLFLIFHFPLIQGCSAVTSNLKFKSKYVLILWVLEDWGLVRHFTEKLIENLLCSSVIQGDTPKAYENVKEEKGG